MKQRDSVINYTLTIVEHIIHQWGNKLPIRIDNKLLTNIYRWKSNEGKKTLTEVFFRVALKLRGLASVLRTSPSRILFLLRRWVYEQIKKK